MTEEQKQEAKYKELWEKSKTYIREMKELNPGYFLGNIDMDEIERENDFDPKRCWAAYKKKLEELVPKD